MSDTDHLSQRVQALLAIAESIAAFLDHPAVEPEHLLMAMLSDRDGVGAIVMDNLGVNRKAFRALVEQSMADVYVNASSVADPAFSDRTRAVIRRMADESLRLGHTYQSTEHLLLALMSDESGEVSRLLKEQGLTVESVTEETMRLLGPSPTS